MRSTGVEDGVGDAVADARHAVSGSDDDLWDATTTHLALPAVATDTAVAGHFPTSPIVGLDIPADDEAVLLLDAVAPLGVRSYLAYPP